MLSSFDRVAEILAGGRSKWGKTPAKYLNKLFRKSYTARLPFLLEENTAVTLVSVPIETALELANPAEKTHRPPRARGGPVCIACYNGADYLLDGSRRIRQAGKAGKSTIEAYVIEVIDS